MKQVLLACGAALLAIASLRADDWPMLGGRPDRNMVSAEKGLPSTWDGAKKKNIKWVAELGDHTYSNPVVSGGRVYIGTDNGKTPDGAADADRGILLCLSAADGSLLWKAVHEKLYPEGPEREAEDARHVGICSTPCVVGNRVYYVSNRAELVCCDALGFSDKKNDGPYQAETRTGERDADFVWILDMRKELGITPNQASASSPLVVGDLVYVVTGQGADYKTQKVINPGAPSFIAVNRTTGQVVWKDSSPGAGILLGQWGSPAYGEVDGKPQVAFPGGDGWLYAFEPLTGKPLWKFNCRALEKVSAEGQPETRNQLVATPVYSGHRVLIALGEDTETGGRPGCLRAIDARQRGDVTKTAELWRLAGEEFGNSISTVAVHEGLVYASQLDGILHCIALETGEEVWKHDLLSTVWGSPLVADGRVFIRNADGEVVILKTGREKKVLAKNETLPALWHGSVIASGGVLYLAAPTKLYAIAEGK